ncbi:replicative DNA helicase [Mycoplasma testudineum]|uniref:Replicative DNA helicase n=1 Tax=Mycoplasma testudineum TaxID=244584 RepID=A0A4R6IGE2_9MOLU|nr:replicative DNA helicase [Mycoplasma testudineum]OYD27113.1 hypothetical protein CG473_00515 [Mycoplasma testudineum]TDO21134.1 replicative DNA helicase [Mycoplasma testudineum]
MYNTKSETNLSDPLVESLVLALLIYNRSTIEEFRGIIKMEDFDVPMHQELFSIIDSMVHFDTTVFEAKNKIKLVNRDSIVTELNRRIKDDHNFVQRFPNLTSEYIDNLAFSLSSSELLIDYVNKLKEKNKYRKIYNLLKENKRAFESDSIIDKPTLDFITEFSIKLNEIYDGQLNTEFENIHTVAMDYLQDLSNRSTTSEFPGIPSGFDDLDEITLGWQNGQLIILAARPGMGKTALAINFAVNAAEQFNKNVLFFSLEMDSSQLVERIIASDSKVNTLQLRKASNLTKEKKTAIQASVSKFSNWNINFSSKHDSELYSIINQIKRANSKKKLDLVIIDYLQLIHIKKKSGGDNRQVEVSKISNQLKALARELEIPIISLAQLSRQVEQRPDKRPLLSDLRESGSIEQDADIVLFMYRDDYYRKNDKSDDRSNSLSFVEIKVSKNRQGQTSTAKLIFNPAHSNFRNMNPDEAATLKKMEAEAGVK